MKRRTCLHQGMALLLAGAGAMTAAPVAQADAFSDYQTAVLRDNYVLMRKLLFRGMDPNTVDERGRPGFVHALQVDSLRVAEVLFASHSLQVNAATPQGETALMTAAIKGHLHWVLRLLDRGADVNKVGWTPLHYAASADHPQSVGIAAVLLERSAYIDAASPNGSTPLMLAAQYGSQRMVELLLDEGADALLRNALGLSAVDFAQRSERAFMVQRLQQAQQAQQAQRAPDSTSRKRW